MTWKSLCSNLPLLFGDSALMVWPPHTYRVLPCQVRQKYFCTVRSIIGLQQAAVATVMATSLEATTAVVAATNDNGSDSNGEG
jgi:hypothetical protein